jgi:hypothetical protein
MTVGELVEALSKEDPSRLVVMSRDSEGNGYSPLSHFWTGAYRAETTWYGDMGLEALTEKDRQSGFGEEDVIEGVPALVLKPTN